MGKAGSPSQDGARAGTYTQPHLQSKDPFTEETAVRWPKEGSDFLPKPPLSVDSDYPNGGVDLLLAPLADSTLHTISVSPSVWNCRRLELGAGRGSGTHSTPLPLTSGRCRAVLTVPWE